MKMPVSWFKCHSKLVIRAQSKCILHCIWCWLGTDRPQTDTCTNGNLVHWYIFSSTFTNEITVMLSAFTYKLSPIHKVYHILGEQHSVRHVLDQWNKNIRLASLTGHDFSRHLQYLHLPIQIMCISRSPKRDREYGLPALKNNHTYN